MWNAHLKPHFAQKFENLFQLVSIMYFDFKKLWKHVFSTWPQMNFRPFLQVSSQCASQPICLIYEMDGLLWQGCLAGSSKTAPRILMFSIALYSPLTFTWMPIKAFQADSMLLSIIEKAWVMFPIKQKFDTMAAF